MILRCSVDTLHYPDCLVRNEYRKGCSEKFRLAARIFLWVKLGGEDAFEPIAACWSIIKPSVVVDGRGHPWWLEESRAP